MAKEEGLTLDSDALRTLWDEAEAAETAYAAFILREPILGYNADLHARQFRFIANRRPRQVGVAEPFPGAENVLPWLDEQSTQGEKLLRNAGHRVPDGRGAGLGMIAACFPGEPVRIGAGWRHAVLAHLFALDADDRYGRFATALSDAGIAAYVGGIDFQCDICLATTDRAGRISGFIHLPVAGAVAELGASVQPSWRRQGLARRLFAAALGYARAADLREIHLASAHPVARRILDSLGHVCILQQAYPRGIVTMEPEHVGR